MDGSCLTASSTPVLGSLSPLSEDLFVDADTGRVGVGTLAPSSALEVVAREEGTDGTSTHGADAGLFRNGGAGLRARGGEGLMGGAGIDAEGGPANTSDGGVGVRGSGGGGFDGFGGNGVVGVAGTGGLGSGFGVFAFGDLGASGIKSFVQPHPHDASKEIHFVSLEGNEAGTYFRGTGRIESGRARIAVPEDFRLVTSPEGLTVQLTAVGALARLAVETQDLDEIRVLGDADVAFHFVVHGVRRGFEDHRTIRTNRSFVPRRSGEPFGAQYSPSYRAILVENGTLHADLVPNEETAARLGWPLAPAEEERGDRARR
jgi:hypothetical protein